MIIEHLFISKVRIKLLKLFFLDTTKEVHIRGIVREVHEEINAVRRELKNLFDAKVLTCERRGNRLYYKVNKDGLLFNELLGMINKEFGLGEKVLAKRDILGDVKFALITNSYLENSHPSQYDVDVLFIGNINMKAVSAAIKLAEDELHREIRYTIMTEEEFAFRKKKRDSFILNILNKHKVMLFGNENELMS